MRLFEISRPKKTSSLSLPADLDSEIVELSSQERQNIMELGHRFPDIWSNLGGSVELKKKIIKILVREIIVNLNDDTQNLQLIIHWHGG